MTAGLVNFHCLRKSLADEFLVIVLETFWLGKISLACFKLGGE